MEGIRRMTTLLDTPEYASVVPHCIRYVRAALRHTEVRTPEARAREVLARTRAEEAIEALPVGEGEKLLVKRQWLEL
jgi:hypothetical protein